MNLDDRKKEQKKSIRVGIIVAHPDDETLWVGGTILSHPSWRWFIVCLCRGSDKDRAPRFYKALKILKSEGIMGNLDDGPEQNPFEGKEVERAIMQLLPPNHFDLIISHNPSGEYTRHIRHEEVSKAVITLWHTGKISTNELWTFAYKNGSKEFYPKPVENKTISHIIKKRKYLQTSNILNTT